MAQTGTDRVKRGMAEMQKGGVIMDVVKAEQAKIAEEAGAVAVMALERVPADIRAAGGVARMADPTIVEEVMNAVSILAALALLPPAVRRFVSATPCPRLKARRHPQASPEVCRRLHR